MLKLVAVERNKLPATKVSVPDSGLARRNPALHAVRLLGPGQVVQVLAVELLAQLPAVPQLVPPGGQASNLLQDFGGHEVSLAHQVLPGGLESFEGVPSRVHLGQDFSVSRDERLRACRQKS